MGENFLLKWNDHSTSILSATSLLFQSSGLTDVTIGTIDQSFRAHKLVLSICSSTFSKLFATDGALSSQQNPFIYMQDVPSKHIDILLRYMYEGEVSVEEADLAPLLTSARGLGIKGLCEVDKNEDQPNNQQSSESLLQQRKKKRKIDNNNFVAQSQPLTNGDDGSPGIQIANLMSSVTMPEEETGLSSDDIIEVDSSKYQAGYVESIVADDSIEEIPEEWLGGDDNRDPENPLEMSDKILNCQYCPKFFNSNWHLKRHLMTHTRDTRFRCTVCQKDFSRNDNLKSHLKTIHGVIVPPKIKSSKQQALSQPS